MILIFFYFLIETFYLSLFKRSIILVITFFNLDISFPNFKKFMILISLVNFRLIIDYVFFLIN